MAKRELPVVRVEHDVREQQAKRGGGNGRTRFVEDKEIPALRKTLAARWHEQAGIAVDHAARDGFSYGVVKVALREKAMAKSHRPLYLFEQAGRTRLIGTQEFGTLLLAVSAGSRVATHSAIETNTTLNGTADVTTIASIEAFGAQDAALSPMESIFQYKSLLVSLFDFRNEQDNAEARRLFRQWLEQRQLSFVERKSWWRVEVKDSSKTEAILGFSLIRAVYPNAPVTIALSPQTPPAPPPALPAPDPKRTYPLLGIFDTGIAPGMTALQPWIDQQFTSVLLQKPPAADDYSHGTFIAGTVIGAGVFNAGLAPVPAPGVRLVDARVFSNVEGTTADDVIARADDIIARRPDVKVWNLSLGYNEPVRVPLFSQFAHELDDLAQRKGVLFVIAAGNYRDPPLRHWPPDGWAASGLDIIGPPADSALGLTVGALAQRDHPQGIVAAGQPAGYSRRGPGAGSLPKPEVVHWGGNCSVNRTPAGGLISLGPSGQLREDFGTSYAAPLVASLSAQAWHALAQSGQATPSAALVKALVIHSAVVNSPQRTATEMLYYGFGMPGQLDELLLCDEETFTSLHTVQIPRSKQIHHECAIPACLLTNGVFSGEVTVTLCYAPKLDPAHGAEYCRSNVEVSLGAYRKDAAGKFHFSGQLPPDPKKPAERYEKALIQHGYKWSPVKVYRRRIESADLGKRWQLRFDLIYRAGEPEPPQPQEAHAVVTFRALEAGKPVYRDGIRALQALNHPHQAVVSTQQVRV